MAEGVPASTSGGYTSAPTTLQSGSAVKRLYAELSVDEISGQVNVVWHESVGLPTSSITAMVVKTPLNSGVPKHVYSVRYLYAISYTSNHLTMDRQLSGQTRLRWFLSASTTSGMARALSLRMITTAAPATLAVRSRVVGFWLHSIECKWRGIDEVDTGKSDSFAAFRCGY